MSQHGADMPMGEQYLTTREVARVRRMSLDSLAHERARGAGPPWIKDGGRVLYPVRALGEYLTDLARHHNGGESAAS
jgi:hypothetical protein